MTFGEDGAVDEYGQALPVLSKSSSKLNVEALMSTPLPTFHGSTPGSTFWTWLGVRMLILTRWFQFRQLFVSGRDNIPLDRGTLCCAWHTNGLLDSAVILTSHPKNFVVGGRHDLVTRPILRFWTRKMAVQPVVRKAELLRGGCTPELASKLNGRSLLNLSTGIAYGYGCFLFPEGTSHDESKMLRFKTGPMRTALSAAALAKGQGKNTPVILPIGLHWRVRHHWRTDCWVEFETPISLESENLSDELASTLAGGEWMEPAADHVNALREEVKRRLVPLTPDAPDWPTYRSWHLLGHLEGHAKANPPRTWPEEVLAGRAIRERLRQEPSPTRESNARKGAQILEDNNLDARAIDGEGRLRKSSPSETFSATVRMTAGLLATPLFLATCWIQILLGKTLGDRGIDDEGLDARTSYQFLAAMFGSFFTWPFYAIIVSLLLQGYIPLQGLPIITLELGTNPLFAVFETLLIASALLPVFWISAALSVNGWDALQDFQRARRRARLRRSEKGEELQKICRQLLESTP